MEPTFTFETELFLWSGDKASWTFARVPEEYTETLKGFVLKGAGFGSIPVKATIGDTSWKTSIFPDKGISYILPVKKDIRKKEQVGPGDIVNLSIQIT